MRRPRLALLSLLFACEVFVACGELTSEADRIEPKAEGGVDGAVDSSSEGWADASACSPAVLTDAAPDANCGAGEVDLSTNPANCGVCGRSCLGLGCGGGMCGAASIVTGGAAYASEVGGDQLFFGQGFGAFRSQLDGAGRVQIGSAGGPVLQVASDGELVFYRATDGLHRAQIDGGSPSHIDDAGAIRSVAVGNSFFFYASGPQVVRAVKNAMFAGKPSTFGAVSSIPVVIADGDGAYFLVEEEPGGLGAVRWITPESNGVLADGLVKPQELAQDATHVYWASGASPEIYRAPKGTAKATPEVVASYAPTQAGVRALTVTDDAVYWVASTGVGGDAKLYKAPKCGGAVTLLRDIDHSGGLAADAQWVYWGTPNGIERVAR